MPTAGADNKVTDKKTRRRGSPERRKRGEEAGVAALAYSVATTISEKRVTFSPSKVVPVTQ